jgi:hypothetical protein
MVDWGRRYLTPAAPYANRSDVPEAHLRLREERLRVAERVTRMKIEILNSTIEGDQGGMLVRGVIAPHIHIENSTFRSQNGKALHVEAAPAPALAKNAVGAIAAGVAATAIGKVLGL